MQTDSEDNDVSSITLKKLERWLLRRKNIFAFIICTVYAWKIASIFTKKKEKKVFASWLVARDSPSLEMFPFRYSLCRRRYRKMTNEKKKKEKGTKNFEISRFRLFVFFEGRSHPGREGEFGLLVNFVCETPAFFSLAGAFVESGVSCAKLFSRWQITLFRYRSRCSLLERASSALILNVRLDLLHVGEFNCALSALYAGARLFTSGKSLKEWFVRETEKRRSNKLFDLCISFEGVTENN